MFAYATEVFAHPLFWRTLKGRQRASETRRAESHNAYMMSPADSVVTTSEDALTRTQILLSASQGMIDDNHQMEIPHRNVLDL